MPIITKPAERQALWAARAGSIQGRRS